MTPLTPLVNKTIEKLFPKADDRETVGNILLEECSDTLPLAENPKEIERIQLAVLKLSEGEAGKFLEAASLARLDWRDVLVAAGFGEDVEAHLKWAEEMG
jgi:hypothetical protein